MVSVIVPVYNVRAYMDACIESILMQTYEDIEVVLVDDGSTDGSGERCDYWRSRERRIRVIHKTNGGLSDARNAGLDVVRGEYVCFVDADDIIYPEMIRTLLEHAQRKGLDVSIGNVLVNDLRTGQVKPYRPLSAFCDENDICTWQSCVRILDAIFNVTACNKLFRTEVFECKRFKRGIKFEDVPMWTDVFFSGVKMGCVNQPIYQYNVNRSGSIVTSGDYRGYPDVWTYQIAGLKRHGLFDGKLAYDFEARITMKFIQAFVRSARETRKEFFLKAQGCLRRCGKLRLSSEHGLLVAWVVWLHAWGCRTLPYFAYCTVFAADGFVANDRINALLKRVLRGG